MPTKPLAGTFFQEQAYALKSNGIKVGIVAVNQQSIKKIGEKLFNKGTVYNIIDNGIPTYIQEIRSWLPNIPYGNALLCKRAFHKMIDSYIEENGTPDLIHAHSAFYGGYAAITYKLKIRTILTEHNSGFVRGLFNKTWKKALMRKVLENVVAKIAVSNFFSEALFQLFPENGRWITVPNIVDASFFLKPIERNNSSNITFLNVGFLTPVKGQKSLLTAFSIFCKEISNAHLLIGGDGPLKDELVNYSKELNIDENVVFLGNLSRDEVRHHMRKADFFVLNSNFETFGVVLIEALAAGLPVLSTRSGGPQDIINDSNGILIENYNQNALVEGLLKLYHHKSFYDKEKIRKDCYDRFSGESIVRLLKDVYNKVLSN
ncbi:glycosyltransferase family 4 protein [Pedobacter boryungensis]|uniref:Glycosyltransferase family 4 protein n=1 Tax=Pedobacter boryungensis TaxID=869962 RepID=A0ABX2DF69_9SPHI|nr:glycosyltransferase family 4 protein [Pedobacter boryungensis]NQX32731.1 glycosyltransferase family 4 protein [Pedobacter boryungensis]